MGIEERKERERLEIRLLIQKAAMEIFIKEGFEKTSIRKIAAEIEYSPSTIYLYYKDKDDLLLELHREAFQKMMHSFEQNMQKPDPFDRLKAMGLAYLEYGFQNPREYELMFLLEAPMEALNCKEEIWCDGKNAIGLLQNQIQQCMDAGYFHSQLNVINASFFLWSQLHGMVCLHLKKRLMAYESLDPKTLILDTYQLLLNLIQHNFK
ncbi:MAG: TetR/AcrR family transcriptional regulator [Bacteroidota bacterium]|nr:TetR/AcrR family transcriptional regulator [Bacteroidota bacterium]